MKYPYRSSGWVRPDILFFMNSLVSCPEGVIYSPLCSAYVEELEQRDKCMDEQLQWLVCSARSPQQSLEDPGSHGLGPARSSELDQSERVTEENFLGATVQLPEEEGPSAGRDNSDQPSYILRSQDGKTRFSGWSYYALHGIQLGLAKLIFQPRGFFRFQCSLLPGSQSSKRQAT